MIAARKNRWFNAWFSRHAEGRIRASFCAMRVRGLEHLREAAARGPVLIVSNHTSWWDPLVCLTLVQRVLGLDGYAMMDAKNLRKLPFFALVGAFGVDLDSPADGAAALREAARLLDRPGRVVWIFPQGAERPHTERPLAFKPGSGAVSRLARQAEVVPLALRYAHGGVERPELLVDIAPAQRGGRDVEANRAAQERAVTEAMDRLEQVLGDPERDGFQTLFALREPALARWATAALSLLARALLRLDRRGARL